MSQFALRFRYLRDEVKKITQDEVADALGVSRSTIAGYESESKNRVPRQDMLQKIANFFDVSIDYLLGRTNDPKDQLPQPNFKPSSRDMKDLDDFLQRDDIMFSGVPMTDEDRQRMRDIATGYFWEAKEMNKRKKKSKED